MGRELDWVRSFFVVGNLDGGHWIAFVDSESCEGCFLTHEVDVGDAVDGEQRSNVLSHVILGDWVLHEDGPDWSELLKHFLDLGLRNSIWESRDKEVSLLLVKTVLTPLHPVLLLVSDDDELLRRLAVREQFVVHLSNGVLSSLLVCKVDQSHALGN